MKRVVFSRIQEGAFAFEMDQLKRFVTNVELSDFVDKGKTPSIFGMISLYDEVIPVLDLYRWFGQKTMPVCENTIFAVMAFSGRAFAFPISFVKKCCEVPHECYHAVPAVFRHEDRGVFREVIAWEGTLYLKICAENILKELMTDTEISGLWEGRNHI